MNARTDSQSLQTPRLQDRYELPQGTVFLTGNQALVRIAVDRKRMDDALGWNTGGFISGYRGSPLGRLDMELWQAQSLLKQSNIHFVPGVNEDLAATGIWGSQYVASYPGAKVDGVFGIWYGKGPGVDRSGDVLKHANLAGTSPRGGVLVLAGDDHSAKSSTVAHQSDYALMAAAIPVLYPSNVQEILDFGLRGLEMSRLSGCWVGLKLVTDVVESGGEVEVGRLHPLPVAPIPDISIRAIDMPLPAEDRLYNLKLRAALGFAQQAGFNRIDGDDAATVGIVTAGKSYGDTVQALQRLGVDHLRPGSGLRLLKVGMVWPLDDRIVRTFAARLQTILVIEEKRPLLEDQVKSILFDARMQPLVLGKYAGQPALSTDTSDPVLPNCNELDVQLIAHALRRVLPLEAPPVPASATAPAASEVPVRKPSFCAGCPHNTSTQLPDGSRALAGIGCHTIAMLTDPRKTHTNSHMGGEGVMWMGQAPFTTVEHMFANMGDGTYFHSGYLAIRQAVAANLRMTYKLLFNGFVSMTGGQPIDGELSVDKAVAQLKAEGVKKIVIVTDDVHAYDDGRAGALRVPVHDRSELDAVQRELRAYPGLSVLIYDQACATEKRRLRKRGKIPDPQVRTFINPEVCEGCGDCGVQSGCLAIEPLETPLGRKRQINQSSCNKDLSCVRGFCPSFVTLHGGNVAPRQREHKRSLNIPQLAEPAIPAMFEPMGLLVAGIGGTGVVTIGAVLTMAAHLDGKAGTSLDLTGLSQKYGAVASHVRLAPDASMLHTARLGPGEADLMLGCDLIVSVGAEAMTRLCAASAVAYVNTELVPTSDFAKQPDWQVDAAVLQDQLRGLLGPRVAFVDASTHAEMALGDAIFANMLLLGYAWQRGRIPLSLSSIRRAIELNGVAATANQRAFEVGRWLATDEQAALRALAPTSVVSMPKTQAESFAEIVADRTRRLIAYQDRALASRYAGQMKQLEGALAARPDGQRLLQTLATQYFRVLAVKDEFEVARLYTSDTFRTSLQEGFSGQYQLQFHLAGGPFGKVDPASGAVTKSTVSGWWLVPAFKLLASLRGLRGTWLDPFRRTAEGRLHRQVRTAYEQDLALIRSTSSADGQALLRLAGWPQGVRGYGHVRQQGWEEAAAARETARHALATGGA